jgi:hypothetical protein
VLSRTALRDKGDVPPVKCLIARRLKKEGKKGAKKYTHTHTRSDKEKKGNKRVSNEVRRSERLTTAAVP